LEAANESEHNIKLRLRDRHASELNRQARAVNSFGTTATKPQRHVLRWDRWLSKYDLQYLTAGAARNSIFPPHVQAASAMLCPQRAAYTASRGCGGVTANRWVGAIQYGHVSFDGECFTFRGVRY